MADLENLIDAALDRLMMHDECTRADLVDHYAFDRDVVEMHGDLAISKARQRRADAWAGDKAVAFNQRKD